MISGGNRYRGSWGRGWPSPYSARHGLNLTMPRRSTLCFLTGSAQGRQRQVDIQRYSDYGQAQMNLLYRYQERHLHTNRDDTSGYDRSRKRSTSTSRRRLMRHSAGWVESTPYPERMSSWQHGGLLLLRYYRKTREGRPPTYRTPPRCSGCRSACGAFKGSDGRDLASRIDAG